MLQFHSFSFSPFSENTYVLFDESKRCAIVDPGCYDAAERAALQKFIEAQGLKPEVLLNTHCHLDHIFGNKFVKDTWNLPFWTHKDEMFNLTNSGIAARMYGVNLDPSPEPDRFLEKGEVISFGNTELEVLFVPGHSAGHIAFLQREQQLLFSGDVLFYGGIGRYDLPGGSLETLMKSIYHTVLPLGDEVQVMSGHGPATTIGRERLQNQFVLDYKDQFA